MTLWKISWAAKESGNNAIGNQMLSGVEIDGLCDAVEIVGVGQNEERFMTSSPPPSCSAKIRSFHALSHPGKQSVRMK